MAAPAESPSRAVKRFDIRFDEHLGLADLRLTGATASRTVTFGRDARWAPRAGSALHLFVSHSPRLDARRSFLTVTLNGGILRSLPLDEQNERGVEMVVSIPVEMIQRANELRLAVVQFAEGGAEPWTAVGSGSFVSLAFDEAPGAASLASLPLPLLDPAGPRDLRLGVLVPSRITLPTLEATALILADLACRAAPRAVDLRFVGSVEDDDPLLIVGTPAEQRLLRAVATPRVTINDGPNGSALAVVGASPIDDATGLVGLTATGPHGAPVLYVTGNTPEAVVRAGWSLAAHSQWQGDLALASSSPAWRAKRRGEWRGFPPPRARFSLSDVGLSPTPLPVNSDTPLRVTIPALPDTRYLSHGHRLRLSLQRLPALLDRPEGGLEVSWNGQRLRRVTAAELPRQPEFTLEMALPAEALRLDNVLALAWKGASGAFTPLTLIPEGTQLYWPREYEARLPDLALLRSSFYPLSLRPDLSDVILVVPDAITEEIFELVCELSAWLGRTLPTDRIGLRVRQASTLTTGERSSSHLILLRTSRGADPFASALPDPRKAGRDGSAMAWPVLQEAVSPWNEKKFVLSYRAGSGSALLRGFRTLIQPRVLAQLKGDTAFVSSQGVACYTLGGQRVFREVSYFTRAEAFLLTHWLALPFIVALASALLFVGVRLALDHRKGGTRPLTRSGGSAGAPADATGPPPAA
jgi:hypothetical protein